MQPLGHDPDYYDHGPGSEEWKRNRRKEEQGWQEQQRREEQARRDRLVELDEENARLRAAISTPEVCAGVVSEVVERARDAAVAEVKRLKGELAEAVGALLGGEAAEAEIATLKRQLTKAGQRATRMKGRAQDGEEEIVRKAEEIQRLENELAVLSGKGGSMGRMREYYIDELDERELKMLAARGEAAAVKKQLADAKVEGRKAEGAWYTSDTDYEKCRRCGRHYSTVWRATDDLWAEFVGDPGGTLCPACFSALCQEQEGPVLHWWAMTGPEWDDEHARLRDAQAKGRKAGLLEAVGRIRAALPPVECRARSVLVDAANDLVKITLPGEEGE